MPNPSNTVERYLATETATVYTAVREFGYEPCSMRDVRSFTPGKKLVGPAKTLRFIPPRADIMRETRKGELSPEYLAMGSCAQGDVLVIDGLGKKHSGIGGDIKLLHLKMQGAAGLVTDAAIRDLNAVSEYGLALFAGGRTVTGGHPELDPFEANCTIQCGGVAVRPGDLVVADDDGVVIVPECIIIDVINYVEEHEKVEEWIKDRVIEEKVAPGKYYPPTEELIRKHHSEISKINK